MVDLSLRIGKSGVVVIGGKYPNCTEEVVVLHSLVLTLHSLRNIGYFTGRLIKILEWRDE